MRVAVVGPQPLPGATASGGIEAVVSTLVPALSRHGADVVVVTCSTEVFRTERFTHEGVRYHVIPTSVTRARLTWFARERRSIAAALRDLEPDVAHAQGANFYGPATLEARLPSIVTLHGIYYREANITDVASGIVERASKRLRGAGNRHFERVTLRDTSDLIIISPYVEEAVQGRTSARMHHIPNPVSAEFYEIVRQPIRGRILFVGTIEPRKNVIGLVRAFQAMVKHVPEARLRIVGRPVDGEYHREVMDTLALDIAQGRAEYLGVIPQDRLLDEYAKASILVLPSREESSPMAIQQAMAAGLPVVASRAGGMDRLVRGGETGLLVSPGVEHELADALADLCISPAARVMGEAARASAEEFRDDTVAGATLDVYRDVLGRRRGRDDAR